MVVKLPIRFPSEAEDLRKQVRAEQSATAGAKFLGILDVLSVSETLSRAGKIRAQQLKLLERQEAEWHERMKEFLKKHVAN